jgi:hypothetical protein
MAGQGWNPVLPWIRRVDEMLEAYITKAGISNDVKGWLFRAAASKNGTGFDRPAHAPAGGSRHDPQTRGAPPASTPT